MAKHKITVTVDEELIGRARLLGAGNLSAAVNEALQAHLDRLGRHAALGQLLEQWDEELGPPSETAVSEARGAFDELAEQGRDEGAA